MPWSKRAPLRPNRLARPPETRLARCFHKPGYCQADNLLSKLKGEERRRNKTMKKQNLIIGAIVVVGLIAGCSGQQVVPFEPTSQLDYHNG
jgi:hypothetical protein